MKKKSNRKYTWFIILGLAVIAAVLYFVISSANAKKAASANLQTYTLEKGDLTAIVGATGTVRANQTAVLAWQTSGRIEKINVTVGDRVASEAVLASLLQSSLPQSVILAQADLVTAERNLENLVNSNLNIAQAQLNLANAKQTYDQARWNSLSSNSVRTSDQNLIDAAQSAVYLAEDKVENAQETYDKFESRDDDDPIKASALNALANAKQNLETARKNLNYYVQIPNSEDVAVSDGKVAVALAQYEDAQREWERLKDGPDPDDIAAAEARVAAIKATIGLSTITAPFTGTVTEVSGLAGDQVNAGNSAFRIDDLSHLLVDVEVPEVDINRIKVDQEVDLTFDAINAVQYQGRVIKVARVGTVSGGIVNFKVTIEILNPDEQVLPGMTAAVNVIVSQLTDILTIPNRAVRLVDDQQVVYVLKNGSPTKVEIKIGASSDTTSQVLSGDLKVGDQIILNPPTDFSSFTTSGRPPF